MFYTPILIHQQKKNYFIKICIFAHPIFRLCLMDSQGLEVWLKKN